ncbi:MAG: hypothetical protein IT350_14780 [Deltaproteobacteria bacterium]|nr:hypothetical protein [Deltaproteobacteria bacterium]
MDGHALRTLATILLVLGAASGLFLLGWAVGNPFAPESRAGAGDLDDLAALFAPTPASAPRESDRDAFTCLDPCRHVAECGLVPDIELCVPWCDDEWDARTRACVQETSCDRIEEQCFGESDLAECRAVCAHIADCVWNDLDEPDCVELCLDDWSDAERACLAESPCEKGYECVDWTDEDPCPAVCDKLHRCGAVDGDFGECTQMCEEEMGASLRNCVLAYDCDEMEAVCVEGRLPDAMCVSACDRVLDCELEAMTESSCLATCDEQWDDELTVCLADSMTCDEAGECFSDPGIQCAELCAFFVECGELDPLQYPPCVDTCKVDFTDEERECLMATDCGGINDCLIAPGLPTVANEPDCADACSKLAGCGVIAAPDQIACGESCAGAWTELRINCVREATCQTVSSACFGGAPVIGEGL